MADEAGAVGAKVVTPYFKMVFIVVLIATVVLIGADIAMSILVVKPDSNVQQAITTTDSLGKAGFGAIVGLLGGRIG
jgi:hypothetical protein